MATPLAYAALGELVTERAGVINIGLEGTIIAGAYGALVCAGAGGAAAGVGGAVIAGVLVAALLALFVVALRADQIITGTALSLLGLGLTGALYQVMYGSAGAALHTPTLAPIAVPWLSNIPLLGRALFAQPVLTYGLYVAVPALAWWIYRTPAGLALRAVGEHSEAASAAGISPRRVRSYAILFGGAMGGLSGATLVLAQVGTFTEGMSAGRGFIAIAVVALGRWTPWGVALAALLFGAASALQFLAQSTGWPVPYQVWLATPYVLTLLALVLGRRRSAAPAGLGAR
ncbi:MAG: ABC transporter permease [Gemmatimonadetes bacterium]|nr:ABC transporter permease [Gemmatimonadota bacterium]MBI3504566.1 ABC transporter permease [Pseudomonadota bacterium]